MCAHFCYKMVHLWDMRLVHCGITEASLFKTTLINHRQIFFSYLAGFNLSVPLETVKNMEKCVQVWNQPCVLSWPPCDLCLSDHSYPFQIKVCVPFNGLASDENFERFGGINTIRLCVCPYTFQPNYFFLHCVLPGHWVHPGQSCLNNQYYLP